ncbi:helix-turn-helix transcriptional regulator [Mycoplana rhizolycopersici]|uniref:Autoinducer binding domain-containing protein n=1 Tax=Mycoplana rhizolycopersici TaxID=2746702 RepID=A0ABX2QGU2_9HYPH|nr:helix-turn-helix transcriptional regulator [Rhizobium rhizolycopersici]NVP55589.1 autoinducer binding domain-containing protein [Rhizobium rhizolycopersici]
MTYADNLLMNQQRQADFLSGGALEGVRTEYEVLRLFRRCAEHFDFSHFLVARFPESERLGFAERLVISNWPTEMVRSYDGLGVFHESRLVTDVAQTKRPVTGGAELLAPRQAADIASGLAERFGFTTSVAFLLHTTAAEPFIVVYSGKSAEPDPEKLPALYFTSVQVFECLEQTFAPRPAARERLSGREIECLRWAAAGKSGDEIAIILGISAYTVSSYFKSATKKLDAVNRMQAIASALRLKII